MLEDWSSKLSQFHQLRLLAPNHGPEGVLQGMLTFAEGVKLGRVFSRKEVRLWQK